MTNRYEQSFQPIQSSEIAFLSTVDTTSIATALESTAAPIRMWNKGPGSRSVRLASLTGDDYSVVFGPSTVVATSTGGMLVLGGTKQVFAVPAHFTHIALRSSTDVTVNVTLGYGGG